MTDEIKVQQQRKLIKCLVPSCPNYYHSEIPNFDDKFKFFDFPSEPNVQQIWKQKLRHDENFLIFEKICSSHFKQEDLDGDHIKRGAIPSENLTLFSSQTKISVLKRDEIKEVVDTNERLKERLEQLINDYCSVKEKTSTYKKKIDTINGKITKLKNLKPKNKPKADLITKVFSPAQIKILLGRKKVVWSYDDMAMAFSLRHIGNKESYLYLKETLNIPLPALSAVQKWAASNKLLL